MPILDSEVGGKAVWEDSAEKREASLKERKAKMILAARQYVTCLNAFMTGTNVRTWQTNASAANCKRRC